MDGLLYLQKYGIGGPEFGIKEEFVTERGRQLFHARALHEEGGFLSTALTASWPALTGTDPSHGKGDYCTPRDDREW